MSCCKWPIVRTFFGIIQNAEQSHSEVDISQITKWFHLSILTLNQIFTSAPCSVTFISGFLSVTVLVCNFENNLAWKTSKQNWPPKTKTLLYKNRNFPPQPENRFWLRLKRKVQLHIWLFPKTISSNQEKRKEIARGECR